MTASVSQIVLFTELFPPAVGGSAVLLHGIYSRVRTADVTVLTDPFMSRSAGPTLDGMGITYHSLPTWRGGVANWRALRYHVHSARRLRRLARGAHTVVHCSRAIPEGVGAMLARLTGGPRYACWAHGEDLATALTSRELTAATSAVYRFADAAFANSRNTASLLGRFGVPASKIHVVHPAVDAMRFRPDVDGRHIRERFAGPDDIVLLTVGRLQRRKGHDIALQALARLVPQMPQLRYVIAGDGEEREHLERLVSELRLHGHVFFVGTVADADLPSYYAACDAFLMPNRDDNGDIEGFGIVFLEAAASGRPAIGGNSGGVPEAIEDQVTGVLVDGASVDSVSHAIRRLAADPAGRERMGAAARRRAQNDFSWQRAASLVSDVQRSLVPVDRMAPRWSTIQ